jgi:hypothetical protein
MTSKSTLFDIISDYNDNLDDIRLFVYKHTKMLGELRVSYYYTNCYYNSEEYKEDMYCEHLSNLKYDKLARICGEY